MPNVLDIRRRIRSVKSTRQITKAMKMVSAAKLRRAQERALAARPYAQMLTNVLRSLVERADVIDPETGKAKHPLLETREERNIVLVVVTGDRGLAGGFNSNLLKAAQRFLDTKSSLNVDVECVGRKGRDYFRRRYPAQAANERAHRGGARHRRAPGHSQGAAVQPRLSPSPKTSSSATPMAKSTPSTWSSTSSSRSSRSAWWSSRFCPSAPSASATSSRPSSSPAKSASAPAKPPPPPASICHAQDTTRDRPSRRRLCRPRPVDYIYEQPAAQLFRELLPKYVIVQIYRAMLESVAAEHAARMTAMDSATNNAGELIDSLTLTMNRARQAAITKEIIEIVSGAAAL